MGSASAMEVALVLVCQEPVSEWEAAWVKALVPPSVQPSAWPRESTWVRACSWQKQVGWLRIPRAAKLSSSTRAERLCSSSANFLLVHPQGYEEKATLSSDRCQCWFAILCTWVRIRYGLLLLRGLIFVSSLTWAVGSSWPNPAPWRKTWGVPNALGLFRSSRGHSSSIPPRTPRSIFGKKGVEGYNETKVRLKCKASRGRTCFVQYFPGEWQSG